jgi:16S rRNA (adenine1518-N6/adenine1519-N6)-dimethyltransferase|tara:strand:- start:847 stop:1611 length:765 start_codon:yes stop_codon:yes gene_type:complete
VVNKNHSFRKKWGQNFLADSNLLKRITNTVDPQPEDFILEIGPGEGALTEKILPMVKAMAAIEIDPLLIQHLEDQPELKDLIIIDGDILLQEIDEIPIKTPVRIIGNIPYNITSPIIFWLIEQLDYWVDAFIMMQKEVAERLSANVGTKAYGRFTVVTGIYLDAKYCFTIPPDVFIPKPKVKSAIVHFTKKENPLVSDTDYIRFNKIVSAAFSQRRKMLRNTLKGWSLPDEAVEKIDFSRRPETLTIEEFASLV